MTLAQLAPALSIGLLATLSPCVLPMYPGFLSYIAANAEKLSGQRGVRLLGLFVLAGVLSMMLLLGALIASLRVASGQVLAFATPLADIIVVALGVAMLLGKNPFARLPQIRTPDGVESPYLSAFVYGLLYGPIALPCSGPLVVSVFALSLGVAGFASQLLFFLVFGLGFGLPLLVISLMAHSRQRWILRQFTQHTFAISRVGGLLLIGFGLWDFFANLDLVLLYLRA